jgi:hypothetical protein
VWEYPFRYLLLCFSSGIARQKTHLFGSSFFRLQGGLFSGTKLFWQLKYPIYNVVVLRCVGSILAGGDLGSHQHYYGLRLQHLKISI